MNDIRNKINRNQLIYDYQKLLVNKGKKEASVKFYEVMERGFRFCCLAVLGNR